VDLGASETPAEAPPGDAPRREAPAREPAPPIAWRPLGAVAGATAAVLVAFSGRYGYHRDELYYLVAGRHPAWGYDDQPPLIPAIARVMNAVANGSLVALRLPTALVVAATVLLVGLLARELGGRHGAQLLAAACWATSPFTLISGHLLSTTPFDVLFWTLLAYLLARWIRTRDDRLLLALGPVLGIGMLNKNLPLLYAVALLAGVAVAGPRAVLRRPHLWIAAAVAAAIWAPNLWWQATHRWPQLEMTAAIRADADFGGRSGLVPSQLLLMGPPLAPFWIAGLGLLIGAAELRPFRAFGWAYLFTLALVLATGGREYYPAGAYPALFAAGAIGAVRWAAAPARWRRGAIGAALTLNAAASVVLGLPIYPAGTLARTPQAAVNYDAGETVGWPELTATVAAVYRSLPADERARAVILTDNYGEAGAIDRYGRGLGLPVPYSGHNAYWRWGPPPESEDAPVILVGRWSEEELAPYCGSVTRAATNDNGYGLDNDEQGTPIWLCRDRRHPWAQTWPDVRHLG
jgi:4-amino-4-deoxy-L-arabinose transferase-like glycosyltransferase